MNQRSATTILVIDPNPITLLGTAGVLDSLGHTCYCARDLTAAGKTPQHASLDLVVLDVGDDAEAALAFIPEIRDLTATPELPVILIADGCWAGLERRCESIPAARCLFKPIDPNVLGDLVNQSLWFPQLEAVHRRRGQRPQRPGWIELK